MSNTCINALQVSGNAREVARFRQQARGEHQALDPERFMPTPDEIQEPKADVHERLEWRNTNWGTKFPPASVEQTSPDDNTLEYFFDTAWTPLSDGIIRNMSEQFPELLMQLRYAEIGVAFKGHALAKKGTIISADRVNIVDDVDFDDPELLVNLVAFE